MGTLNPLGLNQGGGHLPRLVSAYRVMKSSIDKWVWSHAGILHYVELALKRAAAVASSVVVTPLFSRHQQASALFTPLVYRYILQPFISYGRKLATVIGKKTACVVSLTVARAKPQRSRKTVGGRAHPK